MRGRIKEDDSSIPSKDGPYAYGMSFRTGGEQPYFIRTPRDGGDETILLDGDKEAKDKAYFRLASADHSPDHNRLIWGMMTRDQSSTSSRYVTSTACRISKIF